MKVRTQIKKVMEKFYEKEGFVEASVRDKIITVRWQKLFNSTVIKDCCLAQLEEIKKGANVIVVDSANATGKPLQEVQDWFGEELFPAMQENGLKAIITVLPRSSLAKSGAQQWKNTGTPFGFDMFETSSLIMARKKARELA